MFGRLFLALFAVLPLVEIAFFVTIGRTFGLWPTLFGVVATALAGAAIVRMQGISLLTDIRSSMRGGQLPTRALADATLVALAGFLLLLPGYFTDLLGLLLLVPPVRSALYRYLGGRMAVVARTGHPGMGSARPSPMQNSSRVERRGTIDLDDKQYRER